MANFYREEAIARAKAGVPTRELWQDIRRVEEEEARLVEERARGIETRERKRGVARGRGRWGGGILGYLLGAAAVGAAGLTGGLSLAIPALATGLGSYFGQRVATEGQIVPGRKISPGAMKKFERIAPGRYYVGRGEEREREFEWGETERGRYMQEQIQASALMDALSGYGVAKGGGILDMILGRGGGAGATLPGYAPEAFRLPSLT